jgi:hypothetical protein
MDAPSLLAGAGYGVKRRKGRERKRRKKKRKGKEKRKGKDRKKRYEKIQNQIAKAQNMASHRRRYAIR